MQSPLLQSPRLALPFLAPAQAQKHITHNEAIQMLDTLCHLSVLGVRLFAPENPNNGDLYIVDENASGNWSEKDGQIAQYLDNSWRFFLPQTGWVLWREDIAELTVFTDGTWQAVTAEMNAATSIDLLGINATADTENRLSIKAPATLLDHDGLGHQLKINKSQDGETASLLFQSAYQGQAEIGLTGDNKLHIKVSQDGINWIEAITINNITGQVAIDKDLTIDGHQVNHDGNTPQALAMQGTITGIEDLNDYDMTGIWHQDANSRASRGTNYPAPWAGLLTVIEASPMIYQRYQTYGSVPTNERNATFTRGRYNGAWSAWKRLDNQELT